MENEERCMRLAGKAAELRKEINSIDINGEAKDVADSMRDLKIREKTQDMFGMHSDISMSMGSMSYFSGAVDISVNPADAAADRTMRGFDGMDFYDSPDGISRLTFEDGCLSHVTIMPTPKMYDLAALIESEDMQNDHLSDMLADAMFGNGFVSQEEYLDNAGLSSVDNHHAEDGSGYRVLHFDEDWQPDIVIHADKDGSTTAAIYYDKCELCDFSGEVQHVHTGIVTGTSELRRLDDYIKEHHVYVSDDSVSHSGGRREIPAGWIDLASGESRDDDYTPAG